MLLIIVPESSWNEVNYQITKAGKSSFKWLATNSFQGVLTHCKLNSSAFAEFLNL